VITGGVSPDQTTPVLAIDMLLTGGQTTPPNRCTELQIVTFHDVR
jgi:hypothetical protein